MSTFIFFVFNEAVFGPLPCLKINTLMVELGSRNLCEDAPVGKVRKYKR
jgi:hypothetical protein